MNLKEITTQLKIKPERVRELVNQIDEQVFDICKIVSIASSQNKHQQR